MKKAFITVIALGLAGCGWFDRKVVANVTGYSTICIKETGVTYIQGPSGLAPLYEASGKLVPCK
jgi:hypothetical protein